MPLMEYRQKDVWNETIYKKILHAQPFSSPGGIIHLQGLTGACADDDSGPSTNYSSLRTEYPPTLCRILTSAAIGNDCSFAASS